MIISGIYSITQLSTGKRYIGSSVNIKRRWNSHKSALNRGINDNPHLQNAWKKYGQDSFLFEIIESNINEHLLEQKENEYIVLFGIADKDTNMFHEDKGFNTNWAGRTGCIDPSKYKKGSEHHLYGTVSPKRNKTFEELYGKQKADDLRKGISAAQAGRKGSGMTGKIQSAQSKEKISSSKKNKPWTEARRLAQEKRKLGE